MKEQLTTKDLILRRPRLSDAGAITAGLGEFDVAKMTGSIPYPYFELCADFWIFQARAKWQNNTGHAYMIVTQDGHIVGVMDLFNNEHGDKEIGYWIAKTFWGYGYATQAAQIVVDEAFATLDIEHIDAGHYADNPASGRVLQKIGFKIQNQTANLYSLCRKGYAPGIELRLFKNQGMQST